MSSGVGGVSDWLETLVSEAAALLQLQLDSHKRAGEPPSMRDSGFSWLIGVFLAALASIISNLGLTLQVSDYGDGQPGGNRAGLRAL